jgi:hypothetical protein
VLAVLPACIYTNEAQPSRWGFDEFRGGAMRSREQPPGLTPAGAGVVVVASATPGCRPLGIVSGVMRVPGERPVERTRADFEGSFSPEPALQDMRNLAAANGANAVVIEGHAHEEHHGELGHETYYRLHASAYLCPPTSQ